MQLSNRKPQALGSTGIFLLLSLALTARISSATAAPMPEASVGVKIPP